MLFEVWKKRKIRILERWLTANSPKWLLFP